MALRVQGMVWAAVTAGALAGCGSSPGPILVAGEQSPVWPPPPDAGRIRYLGSFATEEDLKPGRSGLQELGDTLFGKDPPRTMQTPMGVCGDGADRVFVADSTAGIVHVLNLATREYAQWRPPRPVQPIALAYDPAGAGLLLVADSASATILEFDGAGQFLGEFAREHLSRPCGVAFDQARQRVIVADTGAHQIVVLSPDGDELARIGRRGSGPGEFNYPTNVAVDSRGFLYVSDSLNFRVQVFGPDLAAVRQIGRKGDLPGYFSQPKGLGIGQEDRLFVVDANFEAVQVFDAEGSLLMTFGSEGRKPGEFWLPAGIHLDALGRVWVADSFNRRVQVFDQLPAGSLP